MVLVPSSLILVQATTGKLRAYGTDRAIHCEPGSSDINISCKSGGLRDIATGFLKDAFHGLASVFALARPWATNLDFSLLDA